MLHFLHTKNSAANKYPGVRQSGYRERPHPRVPHHRLHRSLQLGVSWEIVASKVRTVSAVLAVLSEGVLSRRVHSQIAGPKIGPRSSFGICETIRRSRHQALLPLPASRLDRARPVLRQDVSETVKLPEALPSVCSYGHRPAYAQTCMFSRMCNFRSA